MDDLELLDRGPRAVGRAKIRRRLELGRGSGTAALHPLLRPEHTRPPPGVGRDPAEEEGDAAELAPPKTIQMFAKSSGKFET